MVSLSYAGLYLRSALVLGLLYALLLAGVAVANIWMGLSLGLVLLLAGVGLILQFLISPFILDWVYHIRWIQVDDLGPGVANFVREVCARHGKPLPRFGVIDDGNPNAFTYGHLPRSARLVLTRGLVEVLDEEELKAVIAHELGHIFHYDFVVMTAAGFIPLVFYYLYDFARDAARSSSSSDKKDQFKGMLALVAFGALIIYYISHYIVLFLSRTREYFADSFAGRETGQPDRLAGALIKIAYGLVGRGETDLAPAADGEAAAAQRPQPRRREVLAGGALGIFDPTIAAAVAMTAQPGGLQGSESFQKAARWELWNPWAWIYELNSTHPLAVKRIQNLSAQAAAMGREPFYRFTEAQPESFWDEFLVDLFMNYLPILTGLFALLSLFAETTGPAVMGGALWGGSLLLSTWFRYRPGFRPATVLDLLGQVKVSQIRPAPAVLEGTIIGRGIPGYFLSEDLVLQDETGYILLDYRQPGALFNWFFALFRVKKLVGGRVQAYGWYRRGPVPYLELRRLVAADGTTYTSYVYPLRLALAILAPLLLVGLRLLMGS